MIAVSRYTSHTPTKFAFKLVLHLILVVELGLQKVLLEVGLQFR
jgi:hypothetical protein